MATATLNSGTTSGSAGGSTSTALTTTGNTALATTSAAPGGALAAEAGASPAAQPGSLLAVTGANLSQAVQNTLAIPAVRRALPFIIMLAVLLIFGLSYAWMQSTPYRPVMPGLSEADQQAAMDALRNADFKPKVDAATGQLTVPSARYHEARMFLAAQGLPKGMATGIDALKDQSSMTTSQFMEQVRVNAAMEQELARSIMQIATVQSARVHLATPKQSVFVRDRTPPKASVVLAPYPGRAVSQQQVQAIVHLVSSSVPYLTPDHVTVVDSVGKLMTSSQAELKLGMTAAQEQHKQQLEEVYSNRILQILGPVVGEANVRTQVNLQLDFTQVETTTEDFDTRDKGPRTRSEVLTEDRSSRQEAAGIPGALSNTPPQSGAASTNTEADTSKGQTEGRGTTSNRQTRNYEIDRTIRHVRSAAGGVNKVSVAVVVNERPAPPPAEGAAPVPNAPTSVPYTQQELDRMLQLVRGVVGFNEQRGDLVSVVPAKFEPPLPMETIPWYIEDKVQTGIKSGLIALSFIAFLLVVVRPIMRMVTAAKAAEEEAKAKEAMGDGELSDEDMRLIQIGEGQSLEEIKAKLKPKKSTISMDMLDTANTYDDKVALIRMLVAEDSGRVANVIKGMIKLS